MTDSARPTHRADGRAVYFKDVSLRKSGVAPRLAAVSGGAVVAAGLVIGGSAAANAGTAVWDSVAQCESSGNWSINTGNGYYGGLQFSPQTWRGFGGTEYAASANQASKAEQIAIAQRVLYTQGPGAWPTCGARAGLTKANGGADPNATPAGSSRGSDEGSRDDSRTPPSSGKLAVDGKFGPKTAAALESWIGVRADGSLSRSDVRALQSKIGAGVDGKIGAETTRKLRAAVGVGSNGAWDFRHDSSSVRALQSFLNSGAKSSKAPSSSAPSSGKLAVDGKFGPKTTAALESWIGVRVDGSLSRADVRALQSKIGAGVDGKIGAETTRKLRAAVGVGSNGAWDFRTNASSVRALQTYLNAH